MILLTMILAFWTSPQWSSRPFVEWAPSYRCAGLTQRNRTVRFGISDGSVFTTPEVGPAFLVLSHENVKSGLWALLRLAPLILLPLSTFWTIWLDHPWWLLFSYDDILALGRLGLRWLNQDLLPIDLDHVHVRWEWSLSSFIWGLCTNFNCPSFMIDWTCWWKTLQSLITW
jgi:hypothetical protein